MFNSEIFASINLRRSYKRNFGIIQDNSVVEHSVELEEGDGFQEADTVFHTSVTHNVNGNVNYDLESMPFSVVGHDINRTLIGPNGTNIKAFSFYNRSQNPLWLKMPFHSDYIRIGPSGESHCSNMDGWRTISTQSIDISGNSNSNYDLFILGNYVLIEVTGDAVISYEYIQNYSVDKTVNLENIAHISVTGEIDVEHVLPVSKDAVLNTEYGVHLSVIKSLNHEYVTEVDNTNSINWEFLGATTTVTSDSILSVEHTIQVSNSEALDVEHVEPSGSSSGGILFGFWF